MINISKRLPYDRKSKIGRNKAHGHFKIKNQELVFEIITGEERVLADKEVKFFRSSKGTSIELFNNMGIKFPIGKYTEYSYKRSYEYNI